MTTILLMEYCRNMFANDTTIDMLAVKLARFLHRWQIDSGQVYLSQVASHLHIQGQILHLPSVSETYHSHCCKKLVTAISSTLSEPQTLYLTVLSWLHVLNKVVEDSASAPPLDDIGGGVTIPGGCMGWTIENITRRRLNGWSPCGCDAAPAGWAGCRPFERSFKRQAVILDWWYQLLLLLLKMRWTVCLKQQDGCI